jgi:hypothetical protein
VKRDLAMNRYIEKEKKSYSLQLKGLRPLLVYLKSGLKRGMAFGGIGLIREVA